MLLESLGIGGPVEKKKSMDSSTYCAKVETRELAQETHEKKTLNTDCFYNYT